jgi:hypothetical protein
MTLSTWLDAGGHPRPTLACWTCGREVARCGFAPPTCASTAGRRRRHPSGLDSHPMLTFSLTIPTFNRLQQIPRTVNSVLAAAESRDPAVKRLTTIGRRPSERHDKMHGKLNGVRWLHRTENPGIGGSTLSLGTMCSSALARGVLHGCICETLVPRSRRPPLW